MTSWIGRPRPNRSEWVGLQIAQCAPSMVFGGKSRFEYVASACGNVA